MSIQDGIGDLNMTIVQTGALANNGTTTLLDRALRVFAL
jgi:hypothetical protein